MLKESPEIKNSKTEKSLSAEELLRIRNTIEVELMKRSGLKEEKWVEINSEQFGTLFDQSENQDLFLDMYRNDREALFALLSQVFSQKNLLKNPHSKEKFVS